MIRIAIGLGRWSADANVPSRSTRPSVSWQLALPPGAKRAEASRPNHTPARGGQVHASFDIAHRYYVVRCALESHSSHVGIAGYSRWRCLSVCRANPPSRDRLKAKRGSSPFRGVARNTNQALASVARMRDTSNTDIRHQLTLSWATATPTCTPPRSRTTPDRSSSRVGATYADKRALRGRPQSLLPITRGNAHIGGAGSGTAAMVGGPDRGLTARRSTVCVREVRAH